MAMESRRHTQQDKRPFVENHANRAYIVPPEMLGMKMCVVKGCNADPSNNAVPACDNHLCERCRMNVVMNHAQGANVWFDRSLCRMCLDMGEIKDLLRELKQAIK